MNDILNERLFLSIVQLKWLGWSYNKIELLTTERDNKMAPNLNKVEVLPRRWLNSYDLLETLLKPVRNVPNTIISELT